METLTNYLIVLPRILFQSCGVFGPDPNMVWVDENGMTNTTFIGRSFSCHFSLIKIVIWVIVFTLLFLLMWNRHKIFRK